MQTVTPETPPTNRLWKGLAAAAAVAVIVVVVGVALLLASGGGDEIEPIAPDATITVDTALATADAYFAAHEAGDFAMLADLFAPDAQGEMAAATSTVDIPELLAFIEPLRMWDIAQGTTRSPVECTGHEGDAYVDVICTYEESRALHHAVGAPPVPIKVTMRVNAEGITNWLRTFSSPNFSTVQNPFDEWMSENHPDDARAARFASWTSLEEAEEFGSLRAEYAQQWAAYLIAEGCTYDYEIC